MSPARPPKREPLSLDRFLSIRRTFLPVLSPDGTRVLFVSNIGGKYNLWSVPVEGGWPTQITNQEDLILEADWVLGGKFIVFTADFEGNENKQLYIIPAEGGEAVNLTDNADVQTFLLGASPDGRKVAYSDNRREPDRFDTYVRDLRTHKEKMVLRRDHTGIDVPSDWSPDGSRLLVYRDDHNLNSHIILTQVRTAPDRWTDLTPHEGDALYNAASFSADGRYAYMVANEGIDFKNIARIDVKAKSPELEWVIRVRHDISGLTLSRDGRYLAYGVNVKGSIRPTLLNLKTRKEVKLGLPKGIYSFLQFSEDSKRLVFQYQGPTQPADIWTMKLKDKRPVQITHSMAGGIDRKRLAAPREVSYLSTDGLRIHGLLYIPKGAKKDRSLPAILYPHGGPNAQNMNLFSMWFQYLLSKGYCIFAPDFRGSTGYGTAFQKLIFRDWGGGDLDDILTGVNVLRDSPYVDPKRIGILGMSFGGFAVLAAITRSPKTFKAAVEAYGPANLFTFIASNPPSWAEGVYALVGHPERDKAYLEERSPMNHVDKIETPLLVIQGRNDPRVAQHESDQIVESLRNRNHTVEYIVFDDEGHGFTKMKNQITALQSTGDFFDRHL